MTQPARSSVGAVVVATLVGGCVVGLTVALQVLGWGADQLLLALGIDRQWWIWLAVSLVNATLVAIPALLLARLPRSVTVREAGRAWLAGASAVALLGLLRMIPGAEPELYLALLALGAMVLRYAWRRRSAPAGSPVPGFTGIAVTAGVVVLLPWLWIGALGGVLETLLAVAAAAALGWLAAAVLDRRFWASFEPSGRTVTVLVGGLVAGVALVLLAAAAGGSGAQLALLLVLPPLGFLAAAVVRRSLGWLIALAALGPLAMLDPEEITILLIGRDLPFWAAVGAAASLGLALLLGLAGWLGGRFILQDPRQCVSDVSPATAETGRTHTGADLRRWLGAATAGVLVVVGAAVYLGLGQPGLHGERLFVILADQADLSRLPAGATGQAGRDARAREVYQRLVSHAEASQADLRADLDRLGLAYTPYYLVNAVEVAGGPAVRAWLAGRDDVDRILRSQRLRPIPALEPPAGGDAEPVDPEWNVAMIGADRVWQLGVTGEGIVVGSSDSGVDGVHPALAGGFRGGDDSWLDPWRHTSVPTDRSGHGTHTLGTAVGRDGIGVAPGAEWTGCVNLDRNLGNPAHYLDCLQFMLAPYAPGADPFADGRPERAPHVLTNSWGCPPIEGCDRTVLRPATAALHAAGIYVVVAAGNTGPFCESIDDPPAPHPDVLTVGAVDRQEEIAFFSSRGPVAGADKPDLVAPGVAVVSAMPGGGYAANSGTSMATPHLAGVVALMWSAEESLIGDVATTTRILADTAQPVPAPEEFTCGGIEELAGAGLVDAYAAVRAVTPPA